VPPLASLADLAPSLGIPAVAVTIAGAIYWALSQAEKVARPEALAQISAVLIDSSWERSVKPWSIMESLFVWTFGERHLSRKCIRRSAISTIIMVASILLFHIMYTRDSSFVSFHHDLYFAAGLVLSAVVNSFIPDYLALLKTRAFLKINHGFHSVFILFLDAACSIAISATFFFLFFIITSSGVICVHSEVWQRK
jgi:hypothetical protein